MPQDSRFEVQITGRENQEWQGRVRFPETGQEEAFASLLELLRLLERQLPH